MIFNSVSFRLLKGEHIGLIGPNSEEKSTFMNIITDKLMPDEVGIVLSGQRGCLKEKKLSSPNGLTYNRGNG